jgi:PAS domain S-box-containing protein
LTKPVSTAQAPFTCEDASALSRRLELLTRVSEIMASSLDYEATLRQVAWLAVPELADWCAVHLVDTNGSVRILLAYANQSNATLARAIQSADPPAPGQTPGVLRLLHTGRPVLFPGVGEDELAWMARGPAHRELLRAAGLRSELIVPLSARGRQLGVLALATAESGRTYTYADVPLAEELARRCALAVDNARMHRETERALHNKEESLALLDTLLRAAPDGLAFLDRELRWVRLNEALATALGTSTERLLGRSVTEDAAAYSPSIEPLLRRVLDTGEPLVDSELSGVSTLAPRQPRYHLMSVYPVRSLAGETLGIGMVVVDITHRKQAENELRHSEERYRHLAELAFEGIAERDKLARANAVLIDELQRALGVREELLAATSHELRTPLAHIKGFTSSLRQPDIEWEEATRQDFLAEIEREADRLSVLIDDLLSMSRLESGTPEQHQRAETTPNALVSAGLDRVRGLLGGARVCVDVPSDLPSVLVDAAQLEQVVANLVENAAKYGPPNVEISVMAAQVGSELELVVEDNGPGIPDDDLERIFDKFFRARTTEHTGLPGTGLGLAISRAIVQTHGGRVWAENRPTGGARLIVRLPLEPTNSRGPR